MYVYGFKSIFIANAQLAVGATFQKKVSAEAMEKSPELLYFWIMRAGISLGSPSAASP